MPDICDMMWMADICGSFVVEFSKQTASETVLIAKKVFSQTRKVQYGGSERT